VVTPEVCDEALASNTAVIVVYHPPIFSPITSMTLSVPLQASLLKCVASGVSVFCPHTSLDSTKGGINDWLAQAFSKYLRPDTVQPLEQKVGEEPGIGTGRMVTLERPTPLATLIPDIKKHLSVHHVQVADAAKDVQTIAICAGSGGSVFSGVKADLYWTGEMAHHDVLAAVARGTNVVLCGHSNTERGYLPLLQQKLTAGLAEEGVQDVEVVVSSKDRDPLTIL